MKIWSGLPGSGKTMELVYQVQRLENSRLIVPTINRKLEIQRQYPDLFWRDFDKIVAMEERDVIRLLPADSELYVDDVDIILHQLLNYREIVAMSLTAKNLKTINLIQGR